MALAQYLKTEDDTDRFEVVLVILAYICQNGTRTPIAPYVAEPYTTAKLAVALRKATELVKPAADEERCVVIWDCHFDHEVHTSYSANFDTANMALANLAAAKAAGAEVTDAAMAVAGLSAK